MRKLFFLMLFALVALTVATVRAEAPAASLQAMRVDAIPFKLNLDPEFEFRDNMLTLKEYQNNSVGPERFQVLWTGPLAENPQHFILETTDTKATLEDETGKILWVEQFEQPSLILTLDKATATGKLTDQGGHSLWTGSWDGKITGRGSSPSHITVDGFEFSFVNGQPASLTDAGGAVLWSGPRPEHGGLLLVENGVRSVVSFHSLPFPANEKLSFEIASVPETAILEDSTHTVQESRTIATIRITKRYSKGYYFDHPIKSQIRPDVMPRPLTDGRFYVVFQDSAGQQVLLQTLDIDSVHTVVLPSGRTFESGSYHRTAVGVQGQIMEDIRSMTSDNDEVAPLP